MFFNGNAFQGPPNVFLYLEFQWLLGKSRHDVRRVCLRVFLPPPPPHTHTISVCVYIYIYIYLYIYNAVLHTEKPQINMIRMGLKTTTTSNWCVCSGSIVECLPLLTRKISQVTNPKIYPAMKKGYSISDRDLKNTDSHQFPYFGGL